MRRELKAGLMPDGASGAGKESHEERIERAKLMDLVSRGGPDESHEERIESILRSPPRPSQP